MKEAEKYFMEDIVALLIEKNQQSKANSQQDPIEMGKHMAYYDVLTLIYQQALAFGLKPEDVGMKDYNPETKAL